MQKPLVLTLFTTLIAGCPPAGESPLSDGSADAERPAALDVLRMDSNLVDCDSPVDHPLCVPLAARQQVINMANVEPCDVQGILLGKYWADPDAEVPGISQDVVLGGFGFDGWSLGFNLIGYGDGVHGGGKATALWSHVNGDPAGLIEAYSYGPGPQLSGPFEGAWIDYSDLDGDGAVGGLWHPGDDDLPGGFGVGYWTRCSP